MHFIVHLVKWENRRYGDGADCR